MGPPLHTHTLETCLYLLLHDVPLGKISNVKIKFIVVALHNSFFYSLNLKNNVLTKK